MLVHEKKWVECNQTANKEHHSQWILINYKTFCYPNSSVHSDFSLLGETILHAKKMKVMGERTFCVALFFNTFMFLISRKLCIGAVVEYLIFCLFVCFISYMYLVSWLVWLKRKILLSFFQLCSSQSHDVSDCRDYAKVKVMKVL